MSSEKKYEKWILCLNVSKIHVGAGGIYRDVGEDGASKCQDSYIFWWATLFWKVHIFLKKVTCLIQWFFFLKKTNNDFLGKRNVTVRAKVSWSNYFTALNIKVPCIQQKNPPRTLPANTPTHIVWIKERDNCIIFPFDKKNSQPPKYS